MLIGCAMDSEWRVARAIFLQIRGTVAEQAA